MNEKNTRKTIIKKHDAVLIKPGTIPTSLFLSLFHGERRRVVFYFLATRGFGALCYWIALVLILKTKRDEYFSSSSTLKGSPRDEMVSLGGNANASSREG